MQLYAKDMHKYVITQILRLQFFQHAKIAEYMQKQKCKKTVVHKISIKYAEYALSIYAMVYFVNICCTPHFVHGYGRM